MKTANAKELNEQYKDCPTQEQVYMIEGSRKERSGMTLNDDGLSDERSPSEPSMAITGITTLSGHEMPYTLIYEYSCKLLVNKTLRSFLMFYHIAVEKSIEFA